MFLFYPYHIPTARDNGKCKINPYAIIQILKNIIQFYSNFIFSVSPQILPFDFGEKSVNSGDLTSLTCSVHKGDLPLKISWTHNNKSINYIGGISANSIGKKISTLSIDSVQEEHKGIYTCTSSNRAGTSSYSAELFVNGTHKHFKYFM